MSDQFPKLYTRNTNGSINVWWAEVTGNAYTTSYGQVDGKIQTALPIYAKGKNGGKANETTDAQQAIVEVNALYKKQRKSNYFDDIDDIDTGFLQCQLATPCADYIDKVDWKSGQIVDHKLNGFACIITAKGAFTRKNEQYHSIPHILKELKPFFDKFPNGYLQGELFNEKYVTELNKIAELIAVTRQPKDITPELLAESERIVQYHIYDGYNSQTITAATDGMTRRSAMSIWLEKQHFKYLKPIIWKVVYSFAEMEAIFKAYVAKGGEGVIIRDPKAPYYHKRTRALLKYKKLEDAEFKIIEICEGKGNWQGCAKKVWCELPNGKREKKFKSNIEGMREHLRKMFNERDRYVGKWITVRFQEYSPFNVPLIPYTDMVVRADIEG